MVRLFGFLFHERQKVLPGLISMPGHMDLTKHSSGEAKSKKIIPVEHDHSFQKASLLPLGMRPSAIQE